MCADWYELGHLIQKPLMFTPHKLGSSILFIEICILEKYFTRPVANNML